MDALEEYRRKVDEQMADAENDDYQRIDLEDAGGKKKSQATILIEIGSRYQLFHDADHEAYAVVHRNGAREVWPIRAKGFRHILASEFFSLTGKGFNRNAAGDALDTLEAKAVHTGKRHQVYLRVARTDEALYLDLCDDAWRIIEVRPDGWSILDRSPVNFIRKPGMEALPVPAGRGDLGKLATLVNVAQRGQLELMVGWMLGALRGKGPYPILVLQGEQGTGKSSGSRIIRRFIDPSTVPLRSPPKEPRDLIVSAINNALVCLDNLSGVNAEISDCLCRFSTGGGLDLRKLYTDSESVMIDVQRPVLVNGIDDICHRPDLSERAVILHLGTLNQTSCVTESKLWKEVEERSPAIMAGLCDALSSALANECSIHLERKPRMADFAVWISAAEPKAPWERGAFMRAYDAMRGRAIEEGIDASPVGSVLVEYLRDLSPVTSWSLTATHLYQTLTAKAGDRAKSQAWPRSPRSMGQALARIAPNLRAIGITYSRDENHDRLYRFVHLPENPPLLPQTPQPSNDAGLSRGRTGAEPSTGAERSAPAQRSAPPSAPLKPSNGAASGERGRRGGNFGDCTITCGAVEGERI